MLYWNDGTESNAYVGNNDQERSRFRFVGEAKIDKDWSAGYVIELGIRDTKSSGVNQGDDEASVVGTTVGILDVRKSAWFLKSKTYGKFEVGREGSAMYHLLDDADFTNARLFADAESMPTSRRGRRVGRGRRLGRCRYLQRRDRRLQGRRPHRLRRVHG